VPYHSTKPPPNNLAFHPRKVRLCCVCMYVFVSCYCNRNKRRNAVENGTLS